MDKLKEGDLPSAILYFEAAVSVCTGGAAGRLQGHHVKNCCMARLLHVGMIGERAVAKRLKETRAMSIYNNGFQMFWSNSRRHPIGFVRVTSTDDDLDRTKTSGIPLRH